MPADDTNGDVELLAGDTAAAVAQLRDRADECYDSPNVIISGCWTRYELIAANLESGALTTEAAASKLEALHAIQRDARESRDDRARALQLRSARHGGDQPCTPDPGGPDQAPTKHTPGEGAELLEQGTAATAARLRELADECHDSTNTALTGHWAWHERAAADLESGTLTGDEAAEELRHLSEARQRAHERHDERQRALRLRAARHGQQPHSLDAPPSATGTVRYERPEADELRTLTREIRRTQDRIFEELGELRSEQRRDAAET
jgi:hypothetical protein